MVAWEGGLGDRAVLAEVLEQGYESRGSASAPRAAMHQQSLGAGGLRSDVVSMIQKSALPTCGTCNTQCHRLQTPTGT